MTIIYTFWLLYCKIPLSLSSSQSVMIQNLQPLTLEPFYWPAGFKDSQSEHSQLNLIGGSWPPGLCFVRAPSDRSESVRKLGRLLSCWTRTQSSIPPSFSSCVNCLALWCSLNLSGHYSPPSASHPSSLFALFHPALCLATSPHTHVLNQQITGSCSARRPACFIAVRTRFPFFLVTAFFFLFSLSISCSCCLSAYKASSSMSSVKK